jgi:hypothetical protein
LLEQLEANHPRLKETLLAAMGKLELGRLLDPHHMEA